MSQCLRSMARSVWDTCRLCRRDFTGHQFGQAFWRLDQCDTIGSGSRFSPTTPIAWRTTAEHVRRWRSSFRQLSGDVRAITRGDPCTDRLHVLVYLDFGIHPRMAPPSALRLAPEFSCVHDLGRLLTCSWLYQLMDCAQSGDFGGAPETRRSALLRRSRPFCRAENWACIACITHSAFRKLLLTKKTAT